jgi:hypothetical protein
MGGRHGKLLSIMMTTKLTLITGAGWGPVPGMMGLGGPGLNRSMHELNKAYLRSGVFLSLRQNNTNSSNDLLSNGV